MFYNPASALAAALMLIGVLSPAAAREAPARPQVLPIEREEALALEALPEPMRAEAGVWVLTSEGYRQVRATSNGYTCIVNRDDVEALKPTCYDREGTETILPAVVWFGNQLMLGRNVRDVRQELSAAFASGRFISPRRAGIAFMLSPNVVNVWVDADGARQYGTAPPHYMIYAPNMTNDDLDLTDENYESMPWLPYVAYAGAHGFLIITIPEQVER
jgi:hypothetical protein